MASERGNYLANLTLYPGKSLGHWRAAAPQQRCTVQASGETHHLSADFTSMLMYIVGSQT